MNRILGGNDKETVLKISERYFQKYDITLEKTLKSELSGDYLKACLAWIEPPSFGDGYLLEVTINHKYNATRSVKLFCIF